MTTHSAETATETRGVTPGQLAPPEELLEDETELEGGQENLLWSGINPSTTGEKDREMTNTP